MRACVKVSVCMYTCTPVREYDRIRKMCSCVNVCESERNDNKKGYHIILVMIST